ncbi:MAG: Unknown protein [uncultured Sulfurovum sp.]|uniref:Uncharacterized protein n=1 Tax=uncultured Sulfurovum sp. TaxID=269237 RepID=A0A6S6SJN1_9BACT|nr:MAG: Unknown protein [uncultured Sulfurovum sp.]
MEITKEDYLILQEILKYKKSDGKKTHTMEQFIQRNIDPKVKVCNYCPSQIRFAWNRIKNWYAKNKEAIDNSYNSIEEDNTNKTAHYCKCGKKELPTKRSKYCDECRIIKK